MTDSWQPSCELSLLKTRARLLSAIRQFFIRRDVLEVETPLLCSATGTDPHLDFFSSDYHFAAEHRQMFLQTSPEFAMKRLLAAGSGSIFQICKAFRNGESGRYHNPEFTILEWYRVGFDLDQLMDEVVELIHEVMPEMKEAVYKVSYQDVFKQYTDLDPLQFCQQSYCQFAIEQKLVDAPAICADDHACWLDFLFSYVVQPALESKFLTLVYGYPAIQSSLARINPQNSLVADRFEVFIKGIEIGNGFFELADAVEQEKRFDQERWLREQRNLPQVAKDEEFLHALRSGLPDCSGIAIGLDRLLMVLSEKQSLAEVTAFPFSRA